MTGSFRQIALVFSLALVYNCASSAIVIPVTVESQKMTDHQEQDAIEDFTRPWSGRRGLEVLYSNTSVVLVKAPLDALSDALAKRALEVRRDVLGSEIEVSGFFQFTYQLVGHSWSILLDEPFSVRWNDRKINSPRLAVVPLPKPAQLSKELKVPVIQLITSDTTGVVEYALFENGEIVEYFSASNDSDHKDTNEFGLKPKRYVLSLSVDDPEAKQISYFWSRRRQVSVKEIGNMWDFANQFLIDHDAFFDTRLEAGYFFMASIRRGGRYQVRNTGFSMGGSGSNMQITSVAPGIDSESVLNEHLPNHESHDSQKQVTSVPELVRVDYFRFGN